VNYLMGGTAGINRLSCLYQLIQMVTRQIETSNEVGESTTELWEVNMSEVALSKLWKCDRKTVSKMLDHMNKLGILSSIQTRRGSVHTLLCISAWIVDGKKFVNPTTKDKCVAMPSSVVTPFISLRNLAKVVV
jgi:hypothetical protein